MSKQVAIEFVVLQDPEENKLRIKTTNPTGIYLATRHHQAAQRYLEECLCEFIVRTGMLQPLYGGGLRIEDSTQWSAIVEKGGARWVFSVVSPAEAERLQSRDTAAPPEELPMLQVKWFKNARNGHSMCIVYDEPDQIDTWIVEMMRADQKKKFAN